MFDKKEYSKLRKAGKRGQGERVKPEIKPLIDGDKRFGAPRGMIIGPKGIIVGRAARRSGKAKIREELEQVVYVGTNHERHVARRKQRELNRHAI